MLSPSCQILSTSWKHSLATRLNPFAVTTAENTNEVLDFLKSKGIKIQHSMPYVPQSNGTAERLNRTILDIAIPILHQSGRPRNSWPYAVEVACYLYNRTPVTGKNLTPVELMFNQKPNLSHLRPFGCRAYVHKPQIQRSSKFDDRAIEGIMIGYPADGKGYLILTPDNKITSSRDVRFDESLFPAYNASRGQLEYGFGATDVLLDYFSNSAAEASTPESPAATSSDITADQSTPPATTPASSRYNLRSSIQQSSGSNSPATAAPLSNQGPTRMTPTDFNYNPRSTARQPALLSTPNPILKPSAVPAFLTSSDLFEPSSFQEAMSCPDKDKWCEAINQEYGSLQMNQTFSELKSVPPGVKPIGVKWVFKIKRNKDGTIKRYKARLVAKGYQQEEGVNYTEIFAPTSQYSTFRAFMAIVAALGLHLEQIDITTAFLQGELEEEVWVQQPEGFVTDPNMAFTLNKPLYGLKQAPRAWHQRLHETLISLGFQPSTVDPCLYILPGESPFYLIIYVDDLLSASKDGLMVYNFKSSLLSTFDGRDLGEPSMFLGISIDRSGSTIKLSQPRLIKDLLAKFHMTECKPKSIPLTVGTVLGKNVGEPLDTSIYPYSTLVGSMLYLACCTRPDISYTVGVLTRFMSNPTMAHWLAAKSLLRYLAATTDYGITYTSTDLQLHGYCDADFAADPDTRRSITGFVFKLAGGAISWSSKRQPTVAASTTEAEYMAASAAVKEALWLKHLLNDFGITTGTVSILGDNQSALKLLRNPISSGRTKHIDVAHHFARERVARKEIDFSYIPTAEQVADVLTKALPECKVNFCCSGMGMA